MTATLTKVAAQMVDELVDESAIEAAYDGEITKSTQYPYVEIHFGDFVVLERMDTDLSNYIDWTGTVFLIITAKTLDAARIGQETVWNTFIPLSSDLSALGVKYIIPQRMSPPGAVDGADNREFQSSVEAKIMIRYDYT